MGHGKIITMVMISDPTYFTSVLEKSPASFGDHGQPRKVNKAWVLLARRKASGKGCWLGHTHGLKRVQRRWPGTFAYIFGCSGKKRRFPSSFSHPSIHLLVLTHSYFLLFTTHSFHWNGYSPLKLHWSSRRQANEERNILKCTRTELSHLMILATAFFPACYSLFSRSPWY